MPVNLITNLTTDILTKSSSDYNRNCSIKITVFHGLDLILGFGNFKIETKFQVHFIMFRNGAYYNLLPLNLNRNFDTKLIIIIILASF